jgi:hypothetical protein
MPVPLSFSLVSATGPLLVGSSVEGVAQRQAQLQSFFEAPSVAGSLS